MHRIFLASMLASACATSAVAQTAQIALAPDPAGTRDFETVVVHGVQPGPGLWKVSKGDHVLWILGTLSPLPKHVTWDSRRVETLVAGAQEVLTGPEVEIKSDAGLFGTLAALPSLIGIRENPGKATLKDVVPADLYARWSVLKARYIGSDSKVEKWRPIFAALELYSAAIEKSDLTQKDIVPRIVTAAAERAGVKITTPKIEIGIAEPRAAAKEFKTAQVDDLDCFRKTLDRIDTDLGTMAARANAWSTGDLDALRKLPYTDQMAACADAVSTMRLAHAPAADDLRARAKQAWFDAATHALDNNRVTFAMLPIARLLPPEGYVKRLRTMGYAVEEPGASTQEPAQTKSVDAAAR